MGEAGQRGRLFGTDGVRGVAGHDLTASLALDLGVAAAAVLAGARAASAAGHAAPVAVVGRDPRASGEFLEAAVVAGLASAGVDVLRLGVIPTPGVAYLTEALGAAFGVVISASHNPAQDNGIKFFGRGGVKLPDAVEDQIEDRLGQGGGGSPRGSDGSPRGETAGVPGVIPRPADVRPGHRRRRRAGTVPGPPAGHAARRPGAGAGRAAGGGRLRARGGVPPRPAGAAPGRGGGHRDRRRTRRPEHQRGVGSTCLDTLAAAVVEHGADAGIAYDGDADRCLAVDADGQPLDGDQILTVLATELREAGRLARDAVVVTVMSNEGFHVAMRDAGIAVIETPVGDKHVSAAMRDGGYVLGGEQSGHIILLEHATTGDGMLTSLQLLAAVNRRGMPWPRRPR